MPLGPVKCSTIYSIVLFSLRFSNSTHLHRSFLYLEILLCLVLTTAALWLSTPSWWSANVKFYFLLQLSIQNIMVPVYKALATSVSAQSPKILNDNTHPATVCSPCCHLTTHTEVSAAVAPDYIAASLFRLNLPWAILIHHQRLNFLKQM